MSANGWDYSEKTQTLIGTKPRILKDIDSGEEFPVNQVFKRVLGQKAFWKVYLMDFLQVLGVLDSKQIDILIYVLENTEQANNTFIGTYAKIQQAVGVAPATVAKVMTRLQEKGFLRKVQNGVWQVSEQIMMKGSEHKRQLLINYYNEEAAATTTSKAPKEPLLSKLEQEGQEVLFDAQKANEEATATILKDTCLICGAELVERTRRDDGKKFMGCPNWKDSAHNVAKSKGA